MLNIKSLLQNLSVIILSYYSLCYKAQANPIPDSTLPIPTAVQCVGNNCTIDRGTAAGGNLFHSFSQFSVPTGGEVFFNNDLGIRNIISRVTGSSESFIDGVLKANGTASLFLLNPNGIVFGAAASLDIGGSFLATTANAIKFADGTFYSATPANTTPLLTVNVPTGVQFGETPGRILVQGEGVGIRYSSEPIDTTVGLHVPSERTLALVGGDVNLDGGTLKTAGGRIELGSVDNGSFVSLTPIDKGWALGYDAVSNFKDIQLADLTAVDASGLGSGDIQVRGRRITLDNGSQIEASTLGNQPSGTINIAAQELVDIMGINATGDRSGVFSSVYDSAIGNGGNLTISTERLRLTEGAFINASAFPNSKGNAGNLTINTGIMTVDGGAQILALTRSDGNGGSLTINARDLVELIGTDSEGTRSGIFFTSESRNAGAAGDVTINTRQLIVRDGARATTSARRAGRGGTLTVNATDSVLLSGISPDGLNPSGLFALSGELSRRTVPEDASGAGGSLRVNTGQLLIRDGAQLSVSGKGSGEAGNLTVNADILRLDNTGSISAESLVGTGGNLNLASSGYILLRTGSTITTNASGTATGGNITIDTPSLVALPAENSNITANAIRGRGGNININTQGIYGLVRNDRPTDRSDITASSEFGVSGQV